MVPDEVLRHRRRAVKRRFYEMGMGDQKAMPPPLTQIKTLASSMPDHLGVGPARAMLHSGSRSNQRLVFSVPCCSSKVPWRAACRPWGSQ